MATWTGRMSAGQRDDEAADDDIATSPFVRGAKVAIVVMGVLIVAGFAFVAVEIWRRQTDPDHAARVQDRGGGGSAATVQSVAGGLRLPEGARIVEQTAVGGRLAVRIGYPDGRQAIYLVSPGSRSIDVQEILATVPAR
jgi:hypothetical protein